MKQATVKSSESGKSKGRKMSELFCAESEMSPVVTAWLHSRDLVVETEVVTTTGLCDLVGFSLRRDAVNQRTECKQRQPLGSRADIFVYECLPEFGTTVRGRTVRALRKIARETYSESLADSIVSVVGRLERHNHVVRSKTGSYFRRNGWWPLHKTICAVELKLAHHSSVLSQARGNKRFCTQSYAAIPADVMAKSRDASIEKYKSAGIGLLSVSRDGCEVIVDPVEINTPNIDRIAAAERFWRKYRGRY